MLPLNQIYHGDCLELLKNVDDKSIDLLITDPPYGINFKSNHRKVKYERIANDNQLDWLEPFLIQAIRVLKDDAHAYIFCSHHNVDIFQSTIRKYLPYKNILVWEKNQFGMGDLRGDYAPQHEFVIFCSNGKRKLNGKRTSNILKYSKTGNKYHSTEKPVDLLEFLIRKSSDEGEVVLDCFAGSASTCIAAGNTNRKWIGIEKNQKIFEVAKERLKI